MLQKAKHTTGHIGTVGDVLNALRALGKEVITGKGGFHVKDEGFLSLRKARQLTGIRAPKRKPRETLFAYGDWAWVEAINKSRNRRGTVTS